MNLFIGLSAVFDFLLKLLLLFHYGLNLLILPVLAVRSLLLSLLTRVGLLKLFLSMHQIDGGSFPSLEECVHLSDTWLFIQNMPREDRDNGQILSFELY